MSLKPVKKSDQEKDWLKKRNDKKINIFPEYHLIVTEGTKTEPNYFEAIKLRINEYFAKVVLESCFPQKFDVLEISDKPDLRHFVSGTGIEVTYSMPKKEAEAVIANAR